MSTGKDERPEYIPSDIELYLEAREGACGDLTIEEFLNAKKAFCEDNVDQEETSRLRHVVDFLKLLRVIENKDSGMPKITEGNVINIFEHRFHRSE